MIRAKFITKSVTASIAALLFTACLAGPCEAASRGHAYLFRGLIGMIDWGMDQLAHRIERGGVTATIDSHLTWRAAAEKAIAEYRKSPEPITAIGHSIGGDSAVEFAEALQAAHVPVALLITYDPTRMSHRVPANVERYINLYQSSNLLGGGDLVQAGGFHGNYASYNLKERSEVIHINLDKFDRIQEQLASKIRTLAATPAHGEGEAVPLRIVIPPSVAIELWDSGVPVTARAGDTLQTLAAAHHAPLWALAQINRISENTALTEGKRIVVPRYLTPKR